MKWGNMVRLEWAEKQSKEEINTDRSVPGNEGRSSGKKHKSTE
jgi:hypothetical protein